MDSWMDGRMDGGMHGCLDAWMHGMDGVNEVNECMKKMT